MKLSISNIAWSADNDSEMYSFLKSVGYEGLEIAPTRIFPECPYEKLSDAYTWSNMLKENFGLIVSSMQSIWYGHTEKMFGSKQERQILIDYTKKAIDFAEVIGCRNLVFGNPKNRDTQDILTNMPIAIEFFKEIGDYALEHNTIVALEPNPTIYNTHFMNYTEQAVEMAYKSSSGGIKVNVDLGTIICNNENVNYLSQIKSFINHVHISEPGLDVIKKRNLHNQLLDVLSCIKYDGFISIEMGNKGDLNKVIETVNYIKSLKFSLYQNT